MGSYLQTSAQFDKANYLVEEDDAEIINQPMQFIDIASDRALICVVNNGPFEAAAYCFDAEEFKDFTLEEDKRPKTWLTMDKTKAEELSGYKE